MSKIPEVPKAKYNQKDPFAWVDYQWEKFMTEQKELKAHIEQLQEDLGKCTKNYSRLYDENKELKKENKFYKKVKKENLL